MADVAEMTDEQYAAFVADLKASTAKALAAAGASAESVDAAVSYYLHNGYQARLTRGELIDFFCVDSPSVVDLAGLADDVADAVVRRFDEIHPRIFAQYHTAGGPA